MSKFSIKIPLKKTASAQGSSAEAGAENAEQKHTAEKPKEADLKVSAPLMPAARVNQSLSTALKQAEKTIARKVGGKDKTPEPIIAVKRQARIMADPEEVKPVVVEPPKPVVEVAPKPVVLMTPAPVEAPKPAEEVKPVIETKAFEPKPAAVESKPTTTSSYVPSKPTGPGAPPAARKDLKAKKPKEEVRFDARDRQGLRDNDNQGWRKRRQFKPAKKNYAEETIRPTKLSIRLPVSIKDLAAEMKLKATQLMSKLIANGVLKKLNDLVHDETELQMLGLEFGCEIEVDTKEEERMRITDLTIRQEIERTPVDQLQLRPPVVTFMGHVDHGKTSLIDSIRKSNRVAHEAGAITQHIGAFKVITDSGEVTILDTPGHEAFTEMRSRGANVTDIVILVIAGDEGIKAQTDEAIRQAREANVPILVALNKCDKPNFDAEKVYRELSDRDLLPEKWGGTIITVDCSAASGQGIKELLEMIALQAEILELRANPNTRARGAVLESEMVKGLGAVATILILNGTLRKGDAIVFGSAFGRIKTIQNDIGQFIDEAGPGCPVKITGLSDLALAGNECIVVKNEKEARELAEARAEGDMRKAQAQVKLSSLERLMAKKAGSEFKILPIILRADAHGSLEAVKSHLLKIHSNKVRLEFVDEAVGDVSESDVQLADASKATIVGFNAKIGARAAEMLRFKKIEMISENVIYAVGDAVKAKMTTLLDLIAEEKGLGEAEVLQLFKSSQLGTLAGCMVKDGIMKRGCLVRQHRANEVIWSGKIASLKKERDDAKEVKEGFHCGILLDGQSDIQVGDTIEAYEIQYKTQEL